MTDEEEIEGGLASDAEEYARQIDSLYEEATNNPCTCGSSCEFEAMGCPYCGAWGAAREKVAALVLEAMRLAPCGGSAKRQDRVDGLDPQDEHAVTAEGGQAPNPPRLSTLVGAKTYEMGVADTAEKAARIAEYWVPTRRTGGPATANEACPEIAARIRTLTPTNPGGTHEG